MTISRSPARRTPRLAAVLLLVAALPGLGGCVGAAIGAGATVGLAAFQERGVEGVARDSALAAQVLSHYLTSNNDLATKVAVDVWEGRVLLTGAVETDELRAEAVRLTWEVSGVKDVLNEIQLKGGEGIQDYAYDTWITTKLSAQLTFDSEVYSINYEVETVNGIVYIIGIAQNQAELDRVIAHANDIERVRRVISHVRVAYPDDGEGQQTEGA